MFDVKSESATSEVNRTDVLNMKSWSEEPNNTE